MKYSRTRHLYLVTSFSLLRLEMAFNCGNNGISCETSCLCTTCIKSSCRKMRQGVSDHNVLHVAGNTTQECHSLIATNTHDVLKCHLDFASGFALSISYSDRETPSLELDIHHHLQFFQKNNLDSEQPTDPPPLGSSRYHTQTTTSPSSCHNARQRKQSQLRL